MSRHRMKNDVDLAWEDNRDQAKATIKRVTRRLENAVLADLAKRFDQAVTAGRVDDFQLDEGAVAGALKRYALALGSAEPTPKGRRVSRRA